MPTIKTAARRRRSAKSSRVVNRRAARNARTRAKRSQRNMSEATATTDNKEASTPTADGTNGPIQIARTELVWPGKYNPDGTRREVPRVSLPFQVIETVNESRATRDTEKAHGRTLFEFYQGKEGDTFEAGWKNKLIWGDNLLVMGSLLEKFAGKIDVIYIDPPFATGADFSWRV
jgi:16S rRNA G966 N2-methylase RsmD